MFSARLGGGTGLIFFRLLDRFANANVVQWSVLDAPELAAIGRDYARKHGYPIRYIERVEAVMHVDVLLINTSLQYLSDYQLVLHDLIKNSPRYICLTRLLCSENTTIVAQQVILGRSTPCVFISRPELTRYLERIGYMLIYDLPNWRDSAAVADSCSKSVRRRLGAYPSFDMVFVKE